jgi:hypothetical protein
MDGNVPDAQVRDLGNAAGHRLPSLDDGCIRDILVPQPSGGEAQANRLCCRFVRHPCRNDGAFFSFLTICIASCDCPDSGIERTSPAA